MELDLDSKFQQNTFFGSNVYLGEIMNIFVENFIFLTRLRDGKLEEIEFFFALCSTLALGPTHPTIQ